MLLLQVPVVQDVAHDQHVGVWQWVGEKVARREAQAVGESVSVDISVENRFNRWQVEAPADEMLMRARNRNRDSALGATDIDDAAVVAPWELGRDGLASGGAEAAHRARELRKPFGICIQGCKEVVSGLHFALRLPGSKGLGQRPQNW